MATKSGLRTQRKGTIINTTSKRQEKNLIKAINRVGQYLHDNFTGIKLHHASEWKTKYVVEKLSKHFPEVDFHYNFSTTAMKPDGGILSIVSVEGEKYPILISEKKNQGTNDLRLLEGKRKQPKGNAIERLGKNVIGFRTALNTETIFPFVCFGDGCDFADDSSILDRVVTIAQFGKLNKIYLHQQGDGAFDRGTFFFKVEEWTENEMYNICKEIAEGSIYYYFSKYKKGSFL